jgi:murein DD-endopeptidase MepM/ murein hydrolase activator NlpD
MRAFLAHVARRSAFSFEVNRIILTRFTLPAADKELRKKAAKGCGYVRRFGRVAKPYVCAYAPPVSAGVAALCAILLFSTLMSDDFTYYEYSYGGKVLGVVKNESAVYQTVSKPETKETIDEKVGAPVVFDEGDDIAVRKVVKLSPSDVSVDGEDDIISNIATLNGVKVMGQAIYSSGSSIGATASEAEAEELLRRVEERWMDTESPDDFSEIEFTGEVTISEVKMEKNDIETADEIFAKLEQTSFSAIGVKTVKTVEYEEEYEEDPIYTRTDERYEDYKLEVTPGAAGLRKVTADIVRVNGEIVSEIPTSYEIIKPAVASHKIRGAKKLPKAVGSGRFIRPAKGAITSPFGPRWGRMHKGLDIDINYGPVYAAGDGKVVYTGNKGDGYGVKIVIDHGDGYGTLYGHLSRSSVNVGDEVYKGQHIATSGNTGSSTGAHLHFEVSVHGVQRNPIEYL